MYETRRSQIARAILEYLHRNPEAQDTVAGIAQWWLPEAKIKARTAIVKEALTELVGEGLILERQAKDFQTHYRLNLRSRKRIERMLKRQPEDI